MYRITQPTTDRNSAVLTSSHTNVVIAAPAIAGAATTALPTWPAPDATVLPMSLPASATRPTPLSASSTLGNSTFGSSTWLTRSATLPPAVMSASPTVPARSATVPPAVVNASPTVSPRFTTV